MSYSLRIPRPVGRLTAAVLTAFLVSGVSTESFAATPWVVQSSPDPGGASEPNTLAAVAATSSTNAWAVGSYTTSDGAADQTLIEHWNGTDWQVQDSPNPGGPPDSLLPLRRCLAHDHRHRS